MSYYALTDSDWPWDDDGEGRAIVVKADTPEEAVKVATERLRAEDPHDGGIGWKVSRLSLVGFEGAIWELGKEPVYDGFTYYPDGINGPPDTPPQHPSSRQALAAMNDVLDYNKAFPNLPGETVEGLRRATAALSASPAAKEQQI